MLSYVNKKYYMNAARAMPSEASESEDSGNGREMGKRKMGR